MVGETDKRHEAEPEPKKPRKPWQKPELRRLKLSEEEAAALRRAEDPQALLRKMWPDLKARNQG